MELELDRDAHSCAKRSSVTIGPRWRVGLTMIERVGLMMITSLRQSVVILKEAAISWNKDNAPMLGAALAYYTVFSVAPLLLITISMASLVLGEEGAITGLSDEIRQTLGPVTADAFNGMMTNAYENGGNTGMTLIGIVILLIGASGAFVQLQDSLNIIWKAEQVPRTGNFVLHFVRNRLLSFAAVMGTGFLLLVSLVVSTVLAAFNNFVSSYAVLGHPILWQILSLAVSFGFITLLFALIFKLLPDVSVRWRDVWMGAILTAFLFAVGQHLIGLYIGQTSLASTFGAAGSLVVLLVWVYYSAQIVLYGAEVTHCFAHSCGSHAPPRESVSSEPRRRRAGKDALRLAQRKVLESQRRRPPSTFLPLPSPAQISELRPGETPRGPH